MWRAVRSAASGHGRAVRRAPSGLEASGRAVRRAASGRAVRLAESGRAATGRAASGLAVCWRAASGREANGRRRAASGRRRAASGRAASGRADSWRAVRRAAIGRAVCWRGASGREASGRAASGSAVSGRAASGRSSVRVGRNKHRLMEVERATRAVAANTGGRASSREPHEQSLPTQAGEQAVESHTSSRCQNGRESMQAVESHTSSRCQHGRESNQSRATRAAAVNTGKIEITIKNNFYRHGFLSYQKSTSNIFYLLYDTVRRGTNLNSIHSRNYDYDRKIIARQAGQLRRGRCKVTLVEH